MSKYKKRKYWVRIFLGLVLGLAGFLIFYTSEYRAWFFGLEVGIIIFGFFFFWATSIPND